MVYTCPICKRVYKTASEMANCILVDEQRAAQIRQASENEVNKAMLNAERLIRQIETKFKEIEELGAEYNALINKYKFVDMPEVVLHLKKTKKTSDIRKFERDVNSVLKPGDGADEAIEKVIAVDSIGENTIEMLRDTQELAKRLGLSTDEVIPYAFRMIIGDVSAIFELATLADEKGKKSSEDKKTEKRKPIADEDLAAELNKLFGKAGF
jgi:hypothetical protein